MQRAHIVTLPQVAVDGIVLVVVLSEGHLSLVVVSVPENFDVETGPDVISMLFELRLNVQESKIIKIKS